ncbi:MAG: SPASM domain-containing protein [Bacteroidales bacterium]|nr:SPASM domain-containing protein [Bacteroidales bacterium]
MIAFFTDAFCFLRTLTLAKIGNILKINLSYWVSILFRQVILWGKPYSISIEPVNFCNLACPECPAGNVKLTRTLQSIDNATYEKILKEASYLTYLMLYFQGEPYLHRNLFGLIRMAFQRGIYTAISTNAQLLNDDYAEKTVRSGLQRIIISMDGITQEAYEKYRHKGDLDKVLEGIQRIREWRKELKSKTPYIVVQFIVFKTNQHQLNKVRSFALAAGADKVEIKTAQLYDFEFGHPLMTDIKAYSRYKKGDDNRYVIKSRLSNRCFRLWNGCVITVSGDVVPCCFDKDADHVMGNVNEQSFHNIWKGRKYFEFRKMILANRKKCNICNNCTET